MEVIESGRFKKNYRTNEGFDKGIGFLWSRYNIIVGITNALKTDEEVVELIRFAYKIPKEVYLNNTLEAEEQIMAKVLQITQRRDTR